VKPYTLIIVPRWLYDKLRPAITSTAAWKEYRAGLTEYMVACILTTHYLPHRDGLDKSVLLGYTCGNDDGAIYWHACDDYDAALAHTFHLVADRVGVSPE
jgi:hypothetical protein